VAVGLEAVEGEEAGWVVADSGAAGGEEVG